jgi:hypothetical protein
LIDDDDDDDIHLAVQGFSPYVAPLLAETINVVDKRVGITSEWAPHQVCAPILVYNSTTQYSRVKKFVPQIDQYLIYLFLHVREL